MSWRATALLATLSCKHPGPRAAKGEPIVVGVVLPMTGANASFGQSAEHGVSLAVAQINGAGGLLGRPVQVVLEDDHSRREDAAPATQRLAEGDAVAIIGEISSTVSLTMAPLAQAAGVPLLLPTATNPALTQQGDHVIRVCFPDPWQGAAMARYAFEQLGARRVAVLTTEDSAYSVGLVQAFEQTWSTLGGEVVGRGVYSFGETDFQAPLTEALAQVPDAIYVPGYYTEVGQIAQQARRMGYTGPLLGGDGWDSEELAQIGGDAIQGGLYTNHYAWDDPSPRVRAFDAAYQAQYRTPSDAIAALAYDAMGLLGDAITRSQRAERAAIRDALGQTAHYPGVTGDITLGPDGEPQKPAVIVEITAEGARYKAHVAP